MSGSTSTSSTNSAASVDKSNKPTSKTADFDPSKQQPLPATRNPSSAATTNYSYGPDDPRQPDCRVDVGAQAHPNRHGEVSLDPTSQRISMNPLLPQLLSTPGVGPSRIGIPAP